MTVTVAVTPSRRHKIGKVTLATVESALTTLGANASMRAVQKRIGGSFRDVCAVVNLVRGRASGTVQEALVAGDPRDFGRTPVDALRAIEQVALETRVTQERQGAQLAALERAAVLRQARRDEGRLIDAIEALRRDVATIRPNLAQVAAKDPLALRGMLAGLESHVLEAITAREANGTATAMLLTPAPALDPALLDGLQAGQQALLAAAAGLQAEQQELTAAVSMVHRDLVERHAHHAQRLADSDSVHQRELAHIHRHLAGVRTDLAGVQTDVGTAHTKLVQTHRAQATSLRRTLRMLAMTQLQAAATAAAAIGEAAALERRSAQAIRRILQTPTRRPMPAVKAQRPVSRPLAKATRHTGVRSPLARKPTTAQPRMRPARTATPKANPPKAPHASTSRVPKKRRR